MEVMRTKASRQNLGVRRADGQLYRSIPPFLPPFPPKHTYCHTAVRQRAMPCRGPWARCAAPGRSEAAARCLGLDRSWTVAASRVLNHVPCGRRQTSMDPFLDAISAQKRRLAQKSQASSVHPNAARTRARCVASGWAAG